MRLDKTNSYCSRRDDYDGTCWIEGPNNYALNEKIMKARVYEVPKVWREDGKQYIVKYANISYWKEYDEWSKTIVKVPRGCDVNTVYKVEYYD